MEYREIGRTGKKAGIIGLGCEHLDKKPYDQTEKVIGAALSAGINFFDIFMPGTEVRQNIAKAIGTHRNDVYIQGHIGSTDLNQQYDISRDLPTVKRYFEDCLRIFGGYIDFGMLFFIDSEEELKKVFDGGLADYAQRLKQQGDIGHIGFSSHNPRTAMDLIETGLPETMMFSINLAFDLSSPEVYSLDALEKNWEDVAIRGLDKERAALYALCEQKGIGISVMKTLGAGKLISADNTPFEKPMTVNQCIHYALERPSVFSALIGCENVEQVAEAVAYIDSSDADRDYASFIDGQAKTFAGSCVYCNHCLPCPSEIDIAMVHKYLDIALLDEANIPPSIASHYLSLDANGTDCIACGNCESRCPFGVPIIDNMKKAFDLFG